MKKIEIYAYQIILKIRTENFHPQFLLDLLKGNGLYEEYTTFLGNRWKTVMYITFNRKIISDSWKNLQTGFSKIHRKI